jgi:hypothetical protein
METADKTSEKLGHRQLQEAGIPKKPGLYLKE